MRNSTSECACTLSTCAAHVPWASHSDSHSNDSFPLRLAVAAAASATACKRKALREQRRQKPLHTAAFAHIAPRRPRSQPLLYHFCAQSDSTPLLIGPPPPCGSPLQWMTPFWCDGSCASCGQGDPTACQSFFAHGARWSTPEWLLHGRLTPLRQLGPLRAFLSTLTSVPVSLPCVPPNCRPFVHAASLWIV